MHALPLEDIELRELVRKAQEGDTEAFGMIYDRFFDPIYRYCAFRLPKEVAFPEGVRAVRILREGKRRVIVPADAVWDDFFDAGTKVPANFMSRRKDAPPQKRRLFK